MRCRDATVEKWARQGKAWIEGVDELECVDAIPRGCDPASTKWGPCVQPLPSLSPAAADVLTAFRINETQVIPAAMGGALGIDHQAVIGTTNDIEGFRRDLAFWQLFSTLETAWLKMVNPKTKEE